MVDKTVDKVVDKVVDKTVDKSDRILLELRNNPNITQSQLVSALGYGKTTIQKYISDLKKNGLIERVGSNKDGYWKILE